jgi:OmpA-OmpF porin, OOP family
MRWNVTAGLVVLALVAGAAAGLLIDFDLVRQTGSVEPAARTEAGPPAPLAPATGLPAEPSAGAAPGPAADAPDSAAGGGSGEAASTPASAGTAEPAALPASPPPYQFTARREAGRLVLAGSYPDAAARAEVLALARDLFFEEEVVDEASVAPGAPEGFATAMVAALRHLAVLASGEAVVAGGAVSVSGESLYRQSAERMRQDLAKASPRGWRAEARLVVP